MIIFFHAGASIECRRHSGRMPERGGEETGEAGRKALLRAFERDLVREKAVRHGQKGSEDNPHAGRRMPLSLRGRQRRPRAGFVEVDGLQDHPRHRRDLLNGQNGPPGKAPSTSKSTRNTSLRSGKGSNPGT